MMLEGAKAQQALQASSSSASAAAASAGGAAAAAAADKNDNDDAAAADAEEASQLAATVARGQAAKTAATRARLLAGRVAAPQTLAELWPERYGAGTGGRALSQEQAWALLGRQDMSGLEVVFGMAGLGASLFGYLRLPEMRRLRCVSWAAWEAASHEVGVV